MSLEWPGPDVNNGPTLVISCGTLTGILVVLYAARMYCRIYPRRNLWWDDYTISLAVVIAVAAYALRVDAVQHGLGRHNYFIAPEDKIRAQEMVFIFSCLWYIDVALIRISVAFLLLRFRDSQQRAWAVVLGIVIVVQFLAGIAAVVVQLTVCRPMRFFWEPVEDAYCVPVLFMEIWGYFHTSVGILGDLVLSTMPITFVIKMNIPLARRIFIGALMATGFFTASTAAIKLVYIVRTGPSGDSLWNLYYLAFWSEIEEAVGIIAACIPCMASRIETFLRRVGIIGWSRAVAASLNSVVLSTAEHNVDESKDSEVHSL